MDTILIIIHVAIAVSLIGLVLIQQGKGADMGAAFGSGASQTVFGAQGSGTFLTRSTAVLATVFFLTSLTLAYFSGQANTSDSVVDQIAPPASIIDAETLDSAVPPMPVEHEDAPAVPADVPAVPADVPAAPDAGTSSQSNGADIPPPPPPN